MKKTDNLASIVDHFCPYHLKITYLKRNDIQYLRYE
jgi:hypothetical protein